ncbi:MAG TPA: hypothetical protein VFL61_09725 [Gaiellaceae bacterium]|nr:hypothetical protein [Gaiellaceae bacterium]
MRCDRLLDLRAPHRVACDVETVQHEPADRPEKLSGLAAPVPSARPGQHDALPVENVLHGAGEQAERGQGRRILRLAEDRDVSGEQLRGRVVEVVSVQVGDDDRVQVAHELLRRQRQRDERVRPRVWRVRDRRPRTGGVEHRVDQQAPPLELEQQGRVANQRQPHVGHALASASSR